jgi:hypothetical protein
MPPCAVMPATREQKAVKIWTFISIKDSSVGFFLALVDIVKTVTLVSFLYRSQHKLHVKAFVS